MVIAEVLLQRDCVTAGWPEPITVYADAAISGATRTTAPNICARASAKLIRAVVDRVIVSPAEEKPKSPFDRRAIKVEIIGCLDALLSDTATGEFTITPVREVGGSGGGT